jgi:hypothetical protein
MSLLNAFYRGAFRAMVDAAAAGGEELRLVGAAGTTALRSAEV